VLILVSMHSGLACDQPAIGTCASVIVRSCSLEQPKAARRPQRRCSGASGRAQGVQAPTGTH